MQIVPPGGWVIGGRRRAGLFHFATPAVMYSLLGNGSRSAIYGIVSLSPSPPTHTALLINTCRKYSSSMRACPSVPVRILFTTPLILTYNPLIRSVQIFYLSRGGRSNLSGPLLGLLTPAVWLDVPALCCLLERGGFLVGYDFCTTTPPFCSGVVGYLNSRLKCAFLSLEDGERSAKTRVIHYAHPR